MEVDTAVGRSAGHGSRVEGLLETGAGLHLAS